MNKKLFRLFPLLLVVVLLLSVALTATAQDAPRYRIGALSKTEANEFFVNMRLGYEFAAARYNVEVVWGAMPTEGDTTGQLALLESWVAAGDFDGFVVTPFTANNLNSALAQISAEGKPIVNIDDLIPADVAADAGITITTRIASDNRRAGALVADALMDQLEAGSEIAILEGPAGSPASQNRSGGFQDAVGDTFNIVSIQAANYERSQALNIVPNIINANPDLKAIFAVNDTMALGAMEAVRQAGLEGTILIYGVDAIPEAVDAISAGTLAGSVAQYPNEMAVLGIETIIAILDGRPVTPEIEAPILLITADNTAEAAIFLPDPQIGDWTIGAISKTESNDFFIAMHEGYDRAAADFGVTVEWGAMPTEGDTTGQLALLESWNARGDFDAYCFTPFTANNLLTALTQANADGIPLLNVDDIIPSDVVDEAGLDISVAIASDNRRAGALVAADMLALLEAGSEVAILEGPAGSPASQNRSGGFQDVVGDQLNIVSIQAANYERSMALSIVPNILTANPDIKAIFAVNDTMALGAMEAVRQAGLEGTVLVYGVDAIPEAVEAVNAGTLAGTVAQYPAEMGYLCVQTAIKVLEGRPVTPRLEAPIRLIKREE